MSEPYLILHKVRGEPAFDIATKIVCPLCNSFIAGPKSELTCDECDSTGHWWIIPTSGHRAYPFWFEPLMAEYFSTTNTVCWVSDKPGLGWGSCTMAMPPDLRDHYVVGKSPEIPKLAAQDLLRKLNLPTVPLITRRP